MFDSPVDKKMQRKSKHKEISDINKSSECPVVERGYLDTKDQSENTETQEEKKDSLYHKIIWSGVFVIFVLAIAGHVQFSPGAFGLFFILIIFLAMLFLRIIKK